MRVGVCVGVCVYGCVYICVDDDDSCLKSRTDVVSLVSLLFSCIIKNSLDVYLSHHCI